MVSINLFCLDIRGQSISISVDLTEYLKVN